ncbi:hypothetical protein H2199_008634 [Coniosporium tulheliwenetii]|uniref:Uncharacterized protein n=1 Tax=Coniosporium tulheliwenetii TaxID=3383036 RepID=A0ACC2YIH7_9PEZI|nr:hypothetical protein H2199_008634 [Cladosporium sp. JES 115]
MTASTSAHPHLPEPMVRTASAEGTVLLRHPTADLQSLQGAYVQNVERLEQSAERLSMGSDIAEEIRKMHSEQKLAESRRGSMRSATVEEQRTVPVTRSRNTSTSSYFNSIVDVNSAARCGGYSPGGYVTSPMGSVRSGSWSQSNPSLYGQRSTSKSSRLGHVTQLEDGQDGHEATAADSSVPVLAPPQPRDSSSFSAQYDRIAQEMEQELQSMPANQVQQNGSARSSKRNSRELPTDVPDRPPTAASTDTYQQARTLFHDFDDSTRDRASPGENMVFYPAPVPRMLNLPKRLSKVPDTSIQAKRRTQMLDSLPAEARKSAAWLSDEQRNSYDSVESIVNKRSPRKSVGNLTSLPPQLRASMFFDAQGVSQDVEVKGESAEATLDSILEASAHAPVSAFTDHPFAGHVGDEVYGRAQARRSTVSAMPTSKPENRRSRNSFSLLLGRRSNSSSDQLNKLQKHNSSRLSLGTQLDDHPPPNHHMDGVGENTPLQHSTDADDEGRPADYRNYPDEDEDGHRDDRSLRSDDDLVGGHVPDHAPDDDDHYVDNEPEPEPESVPFHGPPTTLLAELQLRKAAQKLRNRTAANAFPKGMHSTLLELDAVAQIEKKRREKHHVTLAWEDPATKHEERDSDDEDVPLGMLFPGRDGLINKKGVPTQANGMRDWDRPLGLIEKRELEDNEPLSSRRNRLRGVDPNAIRRDASPAKRPVDAPMAPPGSPDLHLAGQLDAPEEADNEEETLAQRKQRLKGKEHLDEAVSGVAPKSVSGDFASEMLSRLGVPKKTPSPSPLPSPKAPVNEEDETLGQRRARLRAEAAANGMGMERKVSGGSAGNAITGNNLTVPSTQRPVLKPSRSMADLLLSNPIGANAARKVSNEALTAALTPGTLLHQSEQSQAKHRAQIYDTNKRSSSYGLDRPLVDVQGPSGTQNANTGFKGGAYNSGTGGAGVSPGLGMGMSVGAQNSFPASAPLNGIYANGNQSGYFGAMAPNPMAAGAGMPFPQVGYPAMAGQQMGVSPFMYPQQLQIQQMQQMMGGMGYPPQMQMQMMAQQQQQHMQQIQMQQMGMMQTGMVQEQPMDSGQRDLIDRWRMSVMP